MVSIIIKAKKIKLYIKNSFTIKKESVFQLQTEAPIFDEPPFTLSQEPIPIQNNSGVLGETDYIDYSQYTGNPSISTDKEAVFQLQTEAPIFDEPPFTLSQEPIPIQNNSGVLGGTDYIDYSQYTGNPSISTDKEAVFQLPIFDDPLFTLSQEPITIQNNSDVLSGTDYIDYSKYTGNPDAPADYIPRHGKK